VRAVHRLTLPRALHPGAWWLWALGMAVAASRTRNPVLLALILAVTGFVVAARRTDAPWAHGYAAFLKLGLVVIGLRVVLQALLSTRSQGNTVLFTLPQVPLPDWANGVKLGYRQFGSLPRPVERPEAGVNAKTMHRESPQ